MNYRIAGQRGMSLIELMIAITLGLVVAAVAISLLTSTLTASSSNLRYTRINQDLRGTMQAIVNDLQRAGHWALADDVVHASATSDLQFSGVSGTVTVTALRRTTQDVQNAFAAPFTDANLAGRTMILLMPDAAGTNQRYDLTISSKNSDSSISVSVPGTLPSSFVRSGSWTILNPFNGVTVGGGGNCVMLAYDLDGDGVRDANEQFGFRLNAGDTAISATTTSTACGAGTWTRFTDEKLLEVTGFVVTDVTPVLATTPNFLNARIKEYLITLDGRLVSENAAQRSLRESIKVRNNEYF